MLYLDSLHLLLLPGLGDTILSICIMSDIIDTNSGLARRYYNQQCPWHACVKGYNQISIAPFFNSKRPTDIVSTRSDVQLHASVQVFDLMSCFLFEKAWFGSLFIDVHWITVHAPGKRQEGASSDGRAEQIAHIAPAAAWYRCLPL